MTGRLDGEALVCSSRAHGEGVIVRLLFRHQGLSGAFFPAGRVRAIRATLMPGNQIIVSLRAHSPGRLPSGSADLVISRARLLADPFATLGLQWICGVLAVVLPERQPYPVVSNAVEALLAAMGHADRARQWLGALVQVERLILAELGFGLDLARCAVTGATTDLVAVSPRTGRAVCASVARAHKGRLFNLPSWLIDPEGAAPDWDGLRAALCLTGHFIERDLLQGRFPGLSDLRGRLSARTETASGPGPEVVIPVGAGLQAMPGPRPHPILQARPARAE